MHLVAMIAAVDLPLIVAKVESSLKNTDIIDHWALRSLTREGTQIPDPEVQITQIASKHPNELTGRNPRNVTPLPP